MRFYFSMYVFLYENAQFNVPVEHIMMRLYFCHCVQVLPNIVKECSTTLISLKQTELRHNGYVINQEGN